jgi:small subunit ribosomal protein S8
MSVSDPLADLITRIRNGQRAGKTEVTMPASSLKLSVCRVLQREGYIEGVEVTGDSKKPELNISLKYYKGQPVITDLQKVSKPGRRVYRSRDRLPAVLGGYGVAIISTSKGIMTDQEARDLGHGGEILCVVS